jgi:hypothetical protein
MARLTITEAIKQSPVGRTRMYSHYIKSGLITVSVGSKGDKYIDSSELLRVFGSIGQLVQGELVKILREQLAKAEQREQQHLAHIDALTLRLEAPKPVKRKNWFSHFWNGSSQ